MKNTPLSAIHESLGAKMAEFAGYNMPISYTGIKEEHHAVRKGVGMFDVSHMGEFIVRGPEALDLVQSLTSNDASKLAIGTGVQYSCLPNDTGGIVDDLLVYRLPEDMCAAGEQAFMLVVNASNMAKDWAWISERNTFDTRLIDISDDTCLLAVQGPLAAEALRSLTDLDLPSMKYYTFAKGIFAGVDNVIVSATGYTGSGGFEIYAPAAFAQHIWAEVMSAGAPFGIKPCGLGCRDTLRLEMGFCLYGNDIDDTTSPIEAGLGWITKTKKAGFTNIEAFRQQVLAGVDRKLVAFVVNDRRVPRHDYVIEDEAGNAIGRVTSGTMSPSLEVPIGMGYVPKSFSAVGTTLFLVVGVGKRVAATVTKLPFYAVG